MKIFILFAVCMILLLTLSLVENNLYRERTGIVV